MQNVNGINETKLPENSQSKEIASGGENEVALFESSGLNDKFSWISQLNEYKRELLFSSGNSENAERTQFLKAEIGKLEAKLNPQVDYFASLNLMS